MHLFKKSSGALIYVDTNYQGIVNERDINSNYTSIMRDHKFKVTIMIKPGQVNFKKLYQKINLFENCYGIYKYKITSAMYQINHLDSIN
jgi:hypothetical protein